MDEGCSHLEKALLSMDRVRCRTMIQEALAASGLAGLEGLVGPALHRIGDRWESGDLALTQVYMSGRICEDLLDELCAGAGEAPPGAPRVGVAVLLDHHQLGKRIVMASLRSAGFRTVDLGQGLGVEELAACALRERVNILMVSVLMLSSAMHIKDLRAALGDGGPLLVVGGAPFRFHPELWREVGADACGTSGVDAAAIALRLLEGTCAQ